MRLPCGAKKKLAKALRRVEKVVMMKFRRDLEQQRKRKAEVLKNRKRSLASR